MASDGNKDSTPKIGTQMYRNQGLQIPDDSRNVLTENENTIPNPISSSEEFWHCEENMKHQGCHL